MAYTDSLYCMGQDINLNTAQRQTLWGVIKAIAGLNTGQPRDLNHGRLSKDSSLINFQGKFNEDDLSIAAFKQRLADAFGVDPATIDHAVESQEWGGYTCPFWTFSRNSTYYFRLGVFAGLNATTEKSAAAFGAYLDANRALWD